MQIRKYAILGLFAAILLYVPSSGFANAESVPNWVKTNAGWWASGDIDQQSFIQGIEYLVNQGIISVPVQKFLVKNLKLYLIGLKIPQVGGQKMQSLMLNLLEQ